MVARTMFLRAKVRRKDGWQAASLFQCSGEPPRGAEQDGAADGVVSGEINDNQEAIWRKTLQVFDETIYDAKLVPGGPGNSRDP